MGNYASNLAQVSLPDEKAGTNIPRQDASRPQGRACSGNHKTFNGNDYGHNKNEDGGKEKHIVMQVLFWASFNHCTTETILYISQLHHCRAEIQSLNSLPKNTQPINSRLRSEI